MLTKRKYFTIAEKLKILDHFFDTKNLNQIAEVYNLNKSTFANWKFNEQKLRQAKEKSNKLSLHPGPKIRKCPIESIVLDYIQFCNDKEIEINTEMIVNFTRENFDNFRVRSRKCLYNWVYRLIKKYGIKFTDEKIKLKKDIDEKDFSLQLPAENQLEYNPTCETNL